MVLKFNGTLEKLKRTKAISEEEKRAIALAKRSVAELTAPLEVVYNQFMDDKGKPLDNPTIDMTRESQFANINNQTGQVTPSVESQIQQQVIQPSQAPSFEQNQSELLQDMTKTREEQPIVVEQSTIDQASAENQPSVEQTSTPIYETKPIDTNVDTNNQEGTNIFDMQRSDEIKIDAPQPPAEDNMLNNQTSNVEEILTKPSDIQSPVIEKIGDKDNSKYTIEARKVKFLEELVENSKKILDILPKIMEELRNRNLELSTIKENVEEGIRTIDGTAESQSKVFPFQSGVGQTEEATQDSILGKRAA